MLQTLELTHFRSYASGLFEFDSGVNIIVGPNASGKTNLLEAIHVIATMSGFKSLDRDLVANGSQWSRLEALTDNGTRVVKLRRDAGKAMELDGIVKKRLSTLTSLPIVVFEPEHMLLLSSEPERRRSYLDGILSATKPGYKQILVAYRRALSQRNRLLKSEYFSADQLFVWDIQLVEKAGVIVTERLKLIDRLRDSSAGYYQAISRSSDILELDYHSTLDTQQYGNSMLSYLRRHVDTDRQRGFTGAGPHRDDLLLTLKSTDARITASRGETRSIILSLKIAEMELLKELLERAPLLLLDDVFSELDGSRRKSLAEALASYQTFITTTDADVVSGHFSGCHIIPIGQ